MAYLYWSFFPRATHLHRFIYNVYKHMRLLAEARAKGRRAKERRAKESNHRPQPKNLREQEEEEEEVEVEVEVEEELRRDFRITRTACIAGSGALP